MDHSDSDLRCSSWEEADDTRNPQDRKDKGNLGFRNCLARWVGVQVEVEAARNFVGGIDFAAADFAVAADDVGGVAAAGNGDFAA